MKKIIFFYAMLSFTLMLSAQVGINTSDPKAMLHVNGNMIIANTPNIENGNVLVISNDGKIGVAESVPARLLLIQSKTNQELAPNSTISTQFNTGFPINIEWTTSDIVTNNIMTYNSSDNTFTFQEDGIYELSGYIVYRAGAKIASTVAQMSDVATNLATLNVTIQVNKINTTTWVNIAGARYLLSGPGVDRYVETVSVPPVLYTATTGDKIRMVFYRPNSTSGMPHGTQSTWGIIKPDGMEFTKGMKVQAY